MRTLLPPFPRIRAEVFPSPVRTFSPFFSTAATGQHAPQRPRALANSGTLPTVDPGEKAPTWTSTSTPSHAGCACLSSGAAAALQQRLGESAVRQERCAADLLYFLSAEWCSRQQRRTAQAAEQHAQLPSGEASPPPSSSVCSTAKLEDQPINDDAACSATSWEDSVQLRAAAWSADGLAAVPGIHPPQLPSNFLDPLPGRAPREEGNTGLATLRLRFQRQQHLLALRRRLAYFLACENDTISGRHDMQREAAIHSNVVSSSTDSQMNFQATRAHVGSVSRRTAFALSLGQSILSVGTGMSETTLDDERRVDKAANGAFRGGLWGGRCRDSGSGEENVGGPTLPLPRASPHYHKWRQRSATFSDSVSVYTQEGFTYVYRSLAQPVELSSTEVRALIAWCARQVCLYAEAVAATVPTPIQVTSLPAMVSGEGNESVLLTARDDRYGQSCSPKEATPQDCEGEGSVKRQVCFTSARHHLSALSTPGSATPSAGVEGAGAPSSPYVRWDRAVEVEEAVSCATALVEFVTVFMRLAMCSLTSHDTASEGDAHAQLHADRINSDKGHFRGEEEATAAALVTQDGRPLFEVVDYVVSSACDTLHGIDAAGVLNAYAAQIGATAAAGDIGDRGGGGGRRGGHSGAAFHDAVHKLSSSLGDAASDRHQQMLAPPDGLAFSESLMVHVLCCERESWAGALRLAERMSTWNRCVDRAFGFPTAAPPAGNPAPLMEMNEHGDEAKSAAGGLATTALRTLSRQVIHLLLYILAQHGRLAEVVQLCWTVCGVRAGDPSFIGGNRNSHPRQSGTDAPSDESCVLGKEGKDFDVLACVVNVAAANADPMSVAELLQHRTLSAIPGTASTKGSHIALSTSENVAYAPTATDALQYVERVVRMGVLPQRVLSAAAYASLLRRFIGDGVRGGGGGGMVEGWVSLSQVWRFGAGLPRHVRAALCLMGFQVNARHGMSNKLSWSDLYLVLTISRQLVRRRHAELRWWQRQLHCAKQVGLHRGTPAVVQPSPDGWASSPTAVSARTGFASACNSEACRAAAAERRRRRRWSDWGVSTSVVAPVPPLGRASHSERRLYLRPSIPEEVCGVAKWEGEREEKVQRGNDTRGSRPLPDRSSYPISERCHLPLVFTLAERSTSPFDTLHIQKLCQAYHTLRNGLRQPPGKLREKRLTLGTSEPCSAVSPPSRRTSSTADIASPVLATLVSKEMLSLLRSTRYKRHIGLFWDTALRVIVAQRMDARAVGSGESSTPKGRSCFAPHHGAEEPPRGGGLAADEQDEEVDREREDVARALAIHADAASIDHPDAVRHLIAPLTFLAPHLSAYTVAALVQRPFRRVFTWQQCFSLLPYTPLGSHSQLWLLRRIAQDNEGRRCVFATPAPPYAGASPLAPSAASGVVKVSPAAPSVTKPSPSTPTAPPPSYRSALPAAPPFGHAGSDKSVMISLPGICLATSPPMRWWRVGNAEDASTQSDRALLSLLLEGHWHRALQAFEQAPSRVRVGGAPHVVRLLIVADVWRGLSERQRRPLVRLAVQSCARSRDGASELLEEVLQTTLAHGLWHTGLHFHQSVAAEQPELVRQCRRAQLYAAQLCRGLLARTSATRTVALMTKAVRQSQWAAAAGYFLRYTVHHSDVEEAEKAASAVAPAEEAELHSLAALMKKGTSAVSSGASLSPFSLLSGTTGGIAVPAELAHVAQAARYAMLHTPALWQNALRWLPQRTLPLPFAHEQALRVLCADNPAKLRALLPQKSRVPVMADRGDAGASTMSASAVAGEASPSEALVSTAVRTTLSLVEAARGAHRPVHPNEAAAVRQKTVSTALRALYRAGDWEQATLLYAKAVESNCMPYTDASLVLETTLVGGAPWQVTLLYFFGMAQRMRPDVRATVAALQACADGRQWETAFRILRQSVLTQPTPVPRLVELAVSTALHCGIWERALTAAHAYRRSRDPHLAHAVLSTYVRTQHWDDAVEYFYDCTRCGLRPLDASLELAILASEAASNAYRKTALMVGAIASALEDLYRLSGIVLEHIIFVQRHTRSGAAQWSADSTGAAAVTESLGVTMVTGKSSDTLQSSFAPDAASRSTASLLVACATDSPLTRREEGRRDERDANGENGQRER